MRRPQNLKSPTFFDKTAVFHSVASKQVEDLFKFLWPFQKSWTFYKTKIVSILPHNFSFWRWFNASSQMVPHKFNHLIFFDLNGIFSRATYTRHVPL